MMIAVILLTACRHEDPEPPVSQHTLLIYISGDNSLSNFADQNIRSCEEGLLNAAEPLNLVIYKDNYGIGGYKKHTPSLFQLHVSPNKNHIDTTYLKIWDKDVDSTDKNHLAEVLSMVFKKYNTSVKGLEIWGHGRSWIPGDTWKEGVESRAAQYAAVDSLHYLEIWEMREAIEKANINFDYMLFDACFMGSIEVAYEFCDNCKMMLASPCEIPDTGFPYSKNIESLSRLNIENPDENLEQVLKECIDNFASRYPDRGAITLFKESEVKKINNAFLQLMKEKADFYSEMGDNPYKYHNEMQVYGRSATGDQFHFYDFVDYTNISGASLEEEVNRAIPYYFMAPFYYDGAGIVRFDHGCGMTITPTQFFSLSNQKEKLSAAYKRIKWGKEE